MSDRRFEIPSHPERVYPASGGIRYEGGSRFVLEPEGPTDLNETVNGALDADRYVVGDWFDLPQPVYLVHDGSLDTGFKVVVIGDAVRIHVLPDTDAAALAAFFDALEEVSTVDWSVTVFEDRAGTGP